MDSKFVRAVLLQFSGIVGVGIFALPYFLYYSNFFFSVWSMFLIAVIMGIVNVFYSHIICKTQGDHQLSGYADKYLGEKFKYITAIGLAVSGLGAVLAYIKLGSNFIEFLFPKTGFLSIGLFLLLIITGYLTKIKKIKRILDYLPFAIIFIAFLLLQITFKNQLPGIDAQSFNISFFGICVFALSGFTVIPEMEEILRGEEKVEKKLMWSSCIGLFLAFVVYVVFSYSVVRLSGNNLSDDSVNGLAKTSYLLAWIVSIFGLLATFKGSVNFMGVFHEIFYRDFKKSARISKIGAIVLPLASLMLFNLSFGSIFGWMGAGSVFVSVFVICLITLKINKSYWRFVLVPLILAVFIFGFVLMI